MRTSEQLIDLDLAIPREKAITRLRAAMVASVASVWRSFSNRRAINRLCDLDEVHLRDIGLSRAEVESVLRSTAFHEDPSRRLSRTARNSALAALHR